MEGMQVMLLSNAGSKRVKALTAISFTTITKFISSQVYRHPKKALKTTVRVRGVESSSGWKKGISKRSVHGWAVLSITLLTIVTIAMLCVHVGSDILRKNACARPKCRLCNKKRKHKADDCSQSSVAVVWWRWHKASCLTSLANREPRVCRLKG